MLFDAAVGGIANIAASGINNRNAIEREDIARKQNYIFGEMAAEEADRRTRALYDDLYSPKAKMEQLKEAGLSPALFYEGAGVGGGSQAGAQGTGASGISPEIFGMNPLEGAQVALAMAQARKANAEADTELGLNERGQAEIQKIIKQTIGIEAETAYKQMTTKLTEINVYVADKTKQFSIDKFEFETDAAKNNAQYLMFKAQKESALAKVEQETINEKIRAEFLKNDNLKAQNLLMRAQTNLAGKQCELIGAQIQNMLEERLQEWVKLQIEGQQVNTYGEYVNQQKDYWRETIDQMQGKLDLEHEKLDKGILQGYINMGVSAATRIACEFIGSK